jgi:hypothetical protein
MGRKKPPQPIDTPQTKRARLSWDPDNVPEGCEPLTANERRLVDVDTEQGLCLRKLCGRPITSRNCTLCAFHGKHFVPGTDKNGKLEPGSKCLNYTFMRLYNNCKRLCDCQKPTCNAIGYCGEGSFQLPLGKKHDKANTRKQWCQALNIGEKDILAGEKTLRIAYWHFPERFRYFDAKARAWKLKKTDKWIDNERKEWLGAVPISNLDEFVNSYLPARHEPTFRLPAVVSTMQKPRQIAFSPSSSRCVSNVPNTSIAPKSAALIGLESAFKGVDAELAVANKSNSDSQKENSSLKQELDTVKQQLKDTKFRLEKVEKEREKERAASHHQLEQHVEEIKALRTRLDEGAEAAKSLRTPLRYEHFLKGGSMAKYADAFFNLPNMEVVEAFLDAINIRKDNDDNDLGMCSRLRRFRFVDINQRKGQRTNKHKGSPSKPIKGLASVAGGRGRPRMLHWKDEFLMYSMYHYGGLSERQIAALFGASITLVGEAVRAFADYLDMFFARAMPNPSGDDLRRNYPDHFIRTFAHANIVMLLDCSDQETQDPKSKSAHAVLYSLYHAQTGAKFAVGCTPTGVVPHSWCSEAYPSCISDPNIVEASSIINLNLVPGDMVEVDKGFLIEAFCALYGVRVMRPTTMRDKQRQQGRGDTEKTQEIGNTRIIIEQVNAQGKQNNRLFAHKFPLLCKDRLTQLMRIGFMFANFRPAFIIGRR